MIELFIEFIDGLFYDGYARELAESNPESYRFELNQFLDNYNYNRI